MITSRDDEENVRGGPGALESERATVPMLAIIALCLIAPDSGIGKKILFIVQDTFQAASREDE